MNFNINNIFGRMKNNFMQGFGLSRGRCQLRYISIKQEELQQFLKDSVYILDVRNRNEFMTMRIKNAINVPVNEIAWNISTIIPDKNSKILVYCLSGARTMEAIQRLNSLGYNNIYIWENGGLNSLKDQSLIEY